MAGTRVDGRDVKLALMPSAAGCESGDDAGRSGGASVASGVTACVVDGTTVGGGWTPTNHMTSTPVAAPPTNELSVVLVAGRRRFRTRPIQSETLVAQVERVRGRRM
jgi:hypothetical protein